MTRKILSLGFDDERPYGDLARTQEGQEYRLKKLDFIHRMNVTLNREGVPRTHFILGDYIDQCVEHVGEKFVQDVYYLTFDEDGNNKGTKEGLLELQQHTYSHLVVMQQKGLEGKVISTPTEFEEDVKQASKVMKRVFDVDPTGIRIPYGYSKDLTEVPSLLWTLFSLGFKYVSTDYRLDNSLVTPLSTHRQPHMYDGVTELVEIPGTGPQDVIYTEEKAQFLLNRKADSPKKINKHFRRLIKTADKIIGKQGSTMPYLHIGLCLHPWAMMEYDSQLNHLSNWIDLARDNGFEILSYNQMATEVAKK